MIAVSCAAVLLRRAFFAAVHHLRLDRREIGALCDPYRWQIMYPGGQFGELEGAGPG